VRDYVSRIRPIKLPVYLKLHFAKVGFERFVRAFDHLCASGEVWRNFKRSGTQYFRIALAATRGAAGARS
jgi:hypothetical protein